MRIFILSIFLGIVTLCAVPAFTQAAPLVPCDGVDCQTCHFIQLGNNIVAWFIKIMAVVCAIVVAVAGFKMVMAGGDMGAISSAREMMTNVIVGFVILLSAWLVIDTVMKVFVKDNIGGYGPWNQIQCVDQPQVTPNNNNNNNNNGNGTVTATGCAGQCAAIPSGITIKSGACSGGGACTISSQIAAPLSEMDRLLDNAGISWQVTEAYPPTVVHQNSCHQLGTCIDANCVGGCSPQQIKTFVDSAAAADMRAVYEVKTQAEVDALLLAGVPSQNVLRVSAITGPHFSVYKK
jgi:hypothetical protein